MIKISIAGDIMCDMEELKAIRGADGGYDFSEKLEALGDFLKKSDYAAGNLETPIADAPYSFERYSFNNPLELAKAVKNAGFSLVSTAMNHCLDRGVSGLESTIDNLDKIGLKHTGTNKTKGTPTGIIENIKGINIGFLSYTYGTNAFANRCYLSDDDKWKVNLFQEQELHSLKYNKLYNSKLFSKSMGVINTVSGKLFKKAVFPPVYERKEKHRHWYFKLMKNDIDALKAKGAEYVIMCLHVGGQHNLKPLKDTIKIIDKVASLGVDAVIGNHEHLPHPCYYENGVIKTLCLGNLSSNYGVTRSVSDKMQDYSVIINLYLEKKEGRSVLSKATFTIAKSLTVEGGKIKSVLLYDLIRNCGIPDVKKKLLGDNLKIYNIIINNNTRELEPALEYEISLGGPKGGGH
jgi:poly-gamma-glutamate synthesis protein (capsule biosynthesis protein)